MIKFYCEMPQLVFQIKNLVYWNVTYPWQTMIWLFELIPPFFLFPSEASSFFKVIVFMNVAVMLIPKSKSDLLPRKSYNSDS